MCRTHFIKKLVWGLLIILGSGNVASATIQNDQIANVALQHVGGSETFTCRIFIQHVINNHLGGDLGAGYRQCYLDFPNSREITDIVEVIRGDIFQISDDVDPTDYSHVHTGIVLENLGNGYFRVVHSNWCTPPCYTVSVTDNLNPHRWAKYGSGDTIIYPNYSAHFYRLGEVSAPSSPGLYPDGSINQAIINCYNGIPGNKGIPIDNGGGAYVHSWNEVTIQDFGESQYGSDGKYAIIYNPDNDTAYQVKEGMWGYYRSNNGPTNFGYPFTSEITALYANSPFVQPGDYVQPGHEVVVQKFQKQNSYKRKTLVFNKITRQAVTHFPIGEFSIGTDYSENGVQLYVTVDSNPANDIAWPQLGALTPTGRWFTKAIIGEQRYNFVQHNSNGQRLGGWGLTVPITEGNSQFADPGGDSNPTPIVIPTPTPVPVPRPTPIRIYIPTSTPTPTPTPTITPTPISQDKSVIFYTNFENDNPFISEDHVTREQGGLYPNGSVTVFEVRNGAGINNSRGLVANNSGLRIYYAVQVKAVDKAHFVHGLTYEISYWIRTDQTGDIVVSVCKDIADWKPYGIHETVAVNNEWRFLQLVFTATKHPEYYPQFNRLTFMSGHLTGNVYLDEIKVQVVEQSRPTATIIKTSTPTSTPTVTPKPSLPPVSSSALLQNDSFDWPGLSVDTWAFWDKDDACNIMFSDGNIVINNPYQRESDTKVQLIQNYILTHNGMRLEMLIRLKAQNSGLVNVVFYKNSPDWDIYGLWKSIDVTTEWQTHSAVFTAQNINHSNPYDIRISIHIGLVEGLLYIDYCKLIKK